MKKTYKMQVYLNETRYRALKKMAKSLEKSVAELIREWIDEKQNQRNNKKITKDPIWKSVGIADSGETDIAQNFDDYLYGEQS